MQGYPTGITLFIDMTAKEWAYMCYLFQGVGVRDAEMRPQYMPPATKYQSELTVRVDVEYLRRHMQLAYLCHIDLNIQGKDSEEWHGNELSDRNKIMEDINVILSKINP